MNIDSSFEHRYSRDIHHTTIAMLGIYPPPYGGVSVHIQRVMDLLAQQHNKVYFFNTEDGLRTEWSMMYFLKLIMFIIRNRPALIFYHSTYLTSSILDLLVLCGLQKLLGHHITIVEHDCRHIMRRSRWFKKLYQWVLRRVEHVVFIGESARISYSNAQMDVAQSSVEGAFIPPVTYNTALASREYPSSLFVFLRECTPIIMVNASHLMLIDGKDIYGLDQCIDMIADLKKNYPDIGLLIVLARIGNDAYFKSMHERMRSKNVVENVYILHNNQELWPLFKHIDIFVRPTLSDGASVSVQEALYFKVPTIASDVCPRPQGTIIFKTGSAVEFSNAIRGILTEKIYIHDVRRWNQSISKMS